MRQNLRKSNRRSIRLPGYDYSKTGTYFVIICAKDRECLFGDIVNREMVLNSAGRMVESVWNELPKFYPRVSTDAFQIMPNHIHGIIVITRSDAIPPVGAGPCACPSTGACPVGLLRNRGGTDDGARTGNHGGLPLRG